MRSGNEPRPREAVNEIVISPEENNMTQPSPISAPDFVGRDTARASDPHMTSAERDQLIQLLNDSQDEFVAAVSELSDTQWNWKPASGSWSVGECAEHLMLAEQIIFTKTL